MEEREQARKEWNAIEKLVNNMPKVASYSDCKRIARQLLGPHARVWRRDNVIRLGIEKNGTKYLTAEAPDYRTALIHTAMCLARARAAQVMPKEAALLSATQNEAEGNVTKQGGEAPG